MELIYYNKKKYGSLILSFLIHLLIILLTITIYKKKEEIFSGFTENSLFKQPAPVTISYQTNTKAPTQATPKTKPILNKILHQAVNKNNNIKEIKNKIEAKNLDSPYKPIEKKIEAEKQIEIKEKIEIDNFNEAKNLEETAQNNIIENSETQAPKAPKMSGKELVKAFLSISRAANNYEAADSTSSEYSEINNSEEGGGDPYAYVNQRLAQLRYASYNTKVNEVLETAFNTRQHMIYFEEDIITSIILSITIQKDGKVKEAILEKATGYQPLDSYILSVIKNVSFAPIPDHLNTSLYHFKHQAGVTMYKGKTGTIIYRRSI